MSLSFFLAPRLIWAQNEATQIFHLSLYSEPKSLEPKGSTQIHHFLLANLYRNLLYWDGKELKPDLAEKCFYRRKQTQILCRLRRDLKWSDGTQLNASEFLQTFKDAKELAQAQNVLELQFLLTSLKQIKAPSPTELLFELNAPDGDFLYALSLWRLSPSKENAFSGPYQLKSWEKGRKILLDSNPYYWKKVPRPIVEASIVAEDSVAFELYQNKQLDFLRRLPTHLISQFSSSSEFHSFFVYRMDYLGLRPEIPKHLRKKMVESLNYSELHKIFQSEGRYGCVPLPTGFFGVAHEPICHEQKQNLAKEPSYPSPALIYAFSALGGESHRKAAELQQQSWIQNMNLKISIEAREDKILQQELRAKKYPIFRKGITLNLPTCLSALEIFQSQSKENLISFQSKEFDSILIKMRQSFQKKKKQELCYKGIKLLMESYQFIPTGRYEIPILARSEFAGWKINPTFQLDLSEIRKKKILHTYEPQLEP